MRARVIGLGQAAAGDDGVGLVVLDRLRERRIGNAVELLSAADDVALVTLLETRLPVVLVDAVLGAPAGRVVELTADQLADREVRSVSTHGIGVCRALALARALAPERNPETIRIVGVTIAQPERHQRRLSSAVAAAVPLAVARVLALIA